MYHNTEGLSAFSLTPSDEAVHITPNSRLIVIQRSQQQAVPEQSCPQKRVRLLAACRTKATFSLSLTLYSPALAAVYAKSRSLRAVLLAKCTDSVFCARLIQFCVLRHRAQKAANDEVDLARDYKWLLIAKILAVIHIDRKDWLSSRCAIGSRWRSPIKA